MISSHRLTVGRLAVYIEPRDVWIGVYMAPGAVYACPLPLLVFRWDRHAVRLGVRRLPPLAEYGCSDCGTHRNNRHDRSCPRGVR